MWDINMPSPQPSPFLVRIPLAPPPAFALLLFLQNGQKTKPIIKRSLITAVIVVNQA